MLLTAMTTSASITTTYGYASHAVLAALFGDAGHMAAASVLFAVMVALACGVSRCFCHNLQHRTPALWKLHRVHHSAEVMAGTTKAIQTTMW